ncbi:MAG: dual specificity protein phosphatase family protein [Pseudomonadota bacterium]
MKRSIFAISAVPTGRLFIMPRPSPERLSEVMAAYRSHRVDVVVSLLEPAEARKLGLENEAQACEAASMRFIQFPIRDMGLPQSDTFATQVEELVGALSAGQGVAVHCRAGIGRSGTMTCCILKKLGHSAAASMDLVSKARGLTVPETDEQRDFIMRFETD